MLTKITKQYAFHDIPLHCDIYEDEHQSPTALVMLYFHPGSLTGGTRELISPWLVQACVERKWTLISASYRFLPQVSAQGIVDDAIAAYTFAQSWRLAAGGTQRRVVLAGASAGAFVANMIPHHLKNGVLPRAIICITGVPSFRHPFFDSSSLISPQPIVYEEVRHWIEGPLCAGHLPEGEQPFELEMLGHDNKRNPEHLPTDIQTTAGLQRWDLFDYYVYENAYPKMLNDIDPGFGWTRETGCSQKYDRWPPTVFIQGAADVSIPATVVEQAVSVLGPTKASLVIADGQPHLFESTSYLEDQTAAMDVVRAALQRLDQMVVAD